MKYLFLVSVLVAGSAFGVEIPSGELTDSQVFSIVATLIGGWSGASAMAITLAAVQIIFIVFRKYFAEKTGLWKFTILSFLSLVIGALSLLVQGLPVSSVLLHASMLPLIQSFVAQLIIQVQNRTEDKALTVLPPK